MPSKTITSNGFEVLVDEDDFSRLDKYSWWASIRGKKVGIFRAGRVNGKKRTIQIHREIMGAKAGEVVDHINRNKFDNQKSNLRICTQYENARNVGPITGKKYKGTSKRAEGNSVGWIATIHCGHERFYLGYFNDEESAARAYDAKALELHKEFAHLNFPTRLKGLVEK